jgi:hypothetical protein
VRETQWGTVRERDAGRLRATQQSADLRLAEQHGELTVRKVRELWVDRVDVLLQQLVTRQPPAPRRNNVSEKCMCVRATLWWKQQRECVKAKGKK